MANIITRRAFPVSLAGIPLIYEMTKSGLLQAADAKLPDPKSLDFKLPKDLTFPDNGKTTGNQQVVLFGNPNEEGSLYGIHFKWHPNSNSRPHSHKYDRLIWVLTGTWWLGTGENYDMATTYPAPAGTFVHHKAKELHYDGAKDEPCTLFMCGIGPTANIQPDGSTGGGGARGKGKEKG